MLWTENFMEIFFFWQMASSKGKIQESWPPLKFHCTARTTSPYQLTSFLMLGNGISLIWCHFYSCYSCLLSKCLFAEKFSNCSNSLNFEAKINCNTIKPNVPKWRKTCTELKYDLPHFYGPQSHILSGDTFEGPCIYIL